MFEGVRGGEGRRATFWKTDLQASRKNFVLRLNTANLLRKPQIHTSPKNFFEKGFGGLCAEILFVRGCSVTLGATEDGATWSSGTTHPADPHAQVSLSQIIVCRSMLAQHPATKVLRSV